MPTRLPRFDRPDPRMIEILRNKTVAEKIDMIFQANRTARMLSAAGIRHQHPDWDGEQVQQEVVRRIQSAVERDKRFDGTERPTTLGGGDS